MTSCPTSDSVALTRSTPPSKSIEIRQASLASFSADSAPYFRCDVTAVTPPNRWNDDVITFFFRFAGEENQKMMSELHQQMTEFYADEKFEAEVGSNAKMPMIFL